MEGRASEIRRSFGTYDGVQYGWVQGRLSSEKEQNEHRQGSLEGSLKAHISPPDWEFLGAGPARLGRNRAGAHWIVRWSLGLPGASVPGASGSGEAEGRLKGGGWEVGCSSKAGLGKMYSQVSEPACRTRGWAG